MPTELRRPHRSDSEEAVGQDRGVPEDTEGDAGPGQEAGRHLLQVHPALRHAQSGTNCIKIGLPGKLIFSKRKGLGEVLFS